MVIGTLVLGVELFVDIPALNTRSALASVCLGLFVLVLLINELLLRVLAEYLILDLLLQ